TASCARWFAPRRSISASIGATSISSSTSARPRARRDRKSTRLNSSHLVISYAVFCLKKKKKNTEDVNILHIHFFSCPSCPPVIRRSSHAHLFLYHATVAFSHITATTH